MISRRDFFAAAAGVAVVTPLPFPIPNQQQQIAPPASVAVLGPMSGNAAQAGAQLVNGVRGAFDDANGLGGLIDHFWTLRTFDDQNTLASALLQSRFAIDDQTQSLAIGPLSGQVASQILRPFSDVAMPVIVPAATTDSITSQGYRNVFRLPTKDSTEGILHARYVKRENRGRKVAVVYQDGNYGPEVASTFIKQASGDGLQAIDIRLSRDRPDFGSAIAAVTNGGADLVFIAGLAPALGPMIPGLRNVGWRGNFNASAGFFDPGIWPSYGKQSEGLIISTSMPPLQIVPAAMAVKTQYEQRYGAMTPIAAFAYSAAQIFISAVRRFNSTQRIQIARALAQPIAFDTLVGTFTFDPFGDPQDPNLYFYELRDAQFNYLRAAHPSSYIVR